MKGQAGADLAAELGNYLESKRVEHSCSVAEVAAELARLYAPELEQQAWLAGLLHDNAKQTPGKALLKVAQSMGLEVSAVEEAAPSLLHGKVGAALLPERFGIDDAEVAQAVVDHVTGRPGMGKLSQILYVADQAAADRTFEGVEDLRATMRESLQDAVLLVATRKIEHAVSKGAPLEGKTVALYNELISKQVAHGEA